MKNYDDMSDFEIDVEITRIITGLDPVDAEPHQRQRCYIARDYHNENHPPEVARQYVDVPRYCKNPSYAWPIITENFISIEMHGHGSSRRVYGYCDKGLVEVMAKNLDDILRAAMICFIKMKDSQQ